MKPIFVYYKPFFSWIEVDQVPEAKPAARFTAIRGPLHAPPTAEEIVAMITAANFDPSDISHIALYTDGGPYHNESYSTEKGFLNYSQYIADVWCATGDPT